MVLLTPLSLGNIGVPTADWRGRGCVMLRGSAATPPSPMQSRIQPTVPSPPQARMRKSGVSRKKLSLEKARRDKG